MRWSANIFHEAGNKWGHKIKISVRLGRDIGQNLIWGMDVRTWAEEGLVHHITVTPRWSSCDDSMPIAEWKASISNVEITAMLKRE